MILDMDKTIRQLTESYYADMKAYAEKVIKDKKIKSAQSCIDSHTEITEYVWSMLEDSEYLGYDYVKLVSTLSCNGDVIDEYEIELECDLADQFDMIRAQYAMLHDVLDLLENENTYKATLKVVQ